MRMPDDLPYENTVILNFENELDLEKVLTDIAASCRLQHIEGRVICTHGTLQTSFEYEHDGT